MLWQSLRTEGCCGRKSADLCARKPLRGALTAQAKRIMLVGGFASFAAVAILQTLEPVLHTLRFRTLSKTSITAFAFLESILPLPADDILERQAVLL